MAWIAQLWESVYPVWEELIRELGWMHLLLALSYAAAAAACWACGQLAQEELGESWGWRVAWIALVLLGVNAVLQLDQLLLLLLRESSRLFGWYEERRVGQFAVVALGVGLVLPTMAWLRTRLSDLWPYCGRVVLGVALLAGLTVMRLISFHETDALLNMDLGVCQLQHLLEAGGLFWVGLGVHDWLERF